MCCWFALSVLSIAGVLVVVGDAVVGVVVVSGVVVGVYVFVVVLLLLLCVCWWDVT